MSTATLEATMKLEISQLQISLAKANGEVAKFKDRLKREGSGLGDALFGDIKKHLGSMLPALGVAATVGGFRAIAGSMDDLADTALRLNETTEMIQRVEHASEILAGVGAEGLTKSFLKLEKSIGDLENEAATKALDDLGISAETLAAVPLDEKILMFAEAFQKARASGTGYNDILDLLGKSAGELIPMFMQTRETIEGLFDEAHIVPDEEVQRLAALNDQIDGFVANLKGWGTTITAGVVGWTESIGEGLGRGIGITAAAFNELLATGSLEKAQAQAFAIMDEQQRLRDQTANDKLNEAPTERAKAGERGATSDDKAGAKEDEANIKARDAAKEKQAKEEEERNKRVHDKYLENENLKREADESKLSIAGKIAAAQERLANAKQEEAKFAAYHDEEGVLDAEKKRLEIEREISRLLVEQGRARDHIADAARKSTQAIKAAADAIAEQKKKEADQREAGAEVEKNLEVLRLRARGKNKEADKVEREQRIKDEAAQAMRDTGVSEAKALADAREAADLQDKIRNRENRDNGNANGEGSHIYGVQKKILMGGGLDEFKARPNKRPLKPGEIPPAGYGRNDLVPVGAGDSLSGRGRREGTMMGGPDQGSLSERGARRGRMIGDAGQGGLSDRADRNDRMQDAREQRDTSGRDIGEKILFLLQQTLT